MSQEFKTVYQFKITLKGFSPKIWRRIQVPENYTFWELHVAIQNAMGWFDSHLHEFSILDPQERQCRIGIPENLWEEQEVVSCYDKKIAEYFSLQNTRALYTYDFGDCWEHNIHLEKILPKDSSIKYPICIAGQRACPPEDCGGVGGYEELLRIIKDPRHEEYASMLEWVGREFNPEEFHCKDVHFEVPKINQKVASAA